MRGLGAWKGRACSAWAGAISKKGVRTFDEGLEGLEWRQEGDAGTEGSEEGSNHV